MTASGTNTTAIAIARTARFSSRSLNVCLFPSRPTPRPCLAFARPRLPGNLSHGCLPFCCVRPPAWFAHPLPPFLPSAVLTGTPLGPIRLALPTLVPSLRGCTWVTGAQSWHTKATCWNIWRGAIDECNTSLGHRTSAVAP